MGVYLRVLWYWKCVGRDSRKPKRVTIDQLENRSAGRDEVSSLGEGFHWVPKVTDFL